MNSVARRAGVAASFVIAMTLALAVGLTVVTSASPAAAQELCDARIDGRSTAPYGSPGRSLDLDIDASHSIEAVAPADATRVVVEVTTPLLSRTVVDAPVAPGGVYSDPDVRLDDDVGPWGVGLYKVEVTAGSCEQTIWVRLTGRSPFATVAGVAGTVAIVAGVGLIGLGVVRAVRRRSRGVVAGLLGGAIGGAGALLLSQQIGWIAITPLEIVTWVVLPAIGGAAVAALASAVSGAGAGAGAAAPVPPSTPSPPPPPSAPSSTSPPPPTAAPPPTAPPTRTPADTEVPRSSYARVEAPDAVVVEEEFVVLVGLAPEPVAGVLGAPLVVPPTISGDYVLVVQVVADGFDIVDGDWRRSLPVTAAEPYPFTAYRLRAAHPAPAALVPEVWSRPIQVLYSIEGQTVGVAIRTIAVVARADILASVAPAPSAPGAVITVAPAEDAPDLTARITYSEAVSDGRLLWTFETTHDLALPPGEIVTDVGDRPHVFASGLIAGVASHRGDPGLVQFLTGIGRAVSEKVPDEFFTLLGAVAARLDRPPRVLLLSQEPYVPWELATVEPAFDPHAPPFLAAQADVGRWVFGSRRPSVPPPLAVDAQDIAVVSGVYPDTAWRLVDAEEEAATLVARWSATSVHAAANSVLDCLEGNPDADVLHFALHGTYEPEGVLEGLILVDGERLDPMVVKGCELRRAPFVFLNACQVGSGNAVLGDYSGLAEAFLHAGAAAVIAPLWSIDDVAAKELALRFYARALGDGVPPASVLRDERRTYAQPGTDAAATRLAYQYFGHPALKLRVIP